MKISTGLSFVVFAFAICSLCSAEIRGELAPECTVNNGSIDLSIVGPFLVFNTPHFSTYYVLQDFDSCDLTKLDVRRPTSGQAVSDVPISFVGLTDIIERRMFDYNYYLNQLVRNLEANPQKFEQSLDLFMDLFSKRFISMYITGHNTNLTSWEQVREFFRVISIKYFDGFTQHVSLNVRVNPVFNSTFAQAVMTSDLIEDSKVKGGGKPGTSVIQATESYTFYWAYESDDQWRIRSWRNIGGGPVSARKPEDLLN